MKKLALKDYFKRLTLTEARMKFAVRVQQVRTVRMNQMSNPEFARLCWRCVHCDLAGRLSPDSQAHITWCPSYQHLREGKDLQDDRDLVQYLQADLQLRDDLDNV